MCRAIQSNIESVSCFGQSHAAFGEQERGTFAAGIRPVMGCFSGPADGVDAPVSIAYLPAAAGARILRDPLSSCAHIIDRPDANNRHVTGDLDPPVHP